MSVEGINRKIIGKLVIDTINTISYKNFDIFTLNKNIPKLIELKPLISDLSKKVRDKYRAFLIELITTYGEYLTGIDDYEHVHNPEEQRQIRNTYNYLLSFYQELYGKWGKRHLLWYAIHSIKN